MATRWVRYREEYEKINEDIDFYRARGDEQVVKCLEARRAQLNLFLNRQRKRVVQEPATSDATFEFDDADVVEPGARQPYRRREDEVEVDEHGEEEEEEEHGEDEEQEDEPPLYDPGTEFEEADIGGGNTAEFRTDVTFDEIIGALLILKTCHKMPWALFLAIVKFIQALLVTDAKVLPKTHQQLKQFFNRVVGVDAKRVIYCRVCEEYAEILPHMMDKPSEVKFCSNCGHDVATDAKEKKGNFILCPVLPQLRSFVKRGNLYEIVENFKEELLKTFRGERFRAVLNRGNIPVVLGSDGAPTGKFTGKHIYPIVMSLGNIPNRFAQGFAILCALFVGRKEDEPPASVFYNLILAELKEFEEKKIRWTQTEKKAIEVVALGGDQPEMRKLANQSTSGYTSCLYCLERGYYDGQAVRFGYKLYKHPQTERTAEKRFADAEEAVRINEEKFQMNGGRSLRPEEQAKVNSIMGHAVLGESPSFHASKSLVCDMMHVVLLGFFKDLLYSMCKGSGKKHNLQRSSREGFTREFFFLLSYLLSDMMDSFETVYF